MEKSGVRQRSTHKSSAVRQPKTSAGPKKTKEQTSIVWRLICCYIPVLVLIFSCGIVVLLIAVESPFDEVKLFSMPHSPPKFEGNMAANNKLQDAVLLFKDKLIGPESMAMHPSGRIYTGTGDGSIVKLDNNVVTTVQPPTCGPDQRHNESACGRPLGLRFDQTGEFLYVADAYHGLYRINIAKNEKETLLSNNVAVNGQKLHFTNDLVLNGDMVIFTDSSVWPRARYIYTMLQGENTGRLLWYNIRTKQYGTLLKGLYFANGVDISAKGDYVLITESTLCRLSKYYISGLLKGKLEIVNDNLPGVPDNIRASGRGTFWISYANIRKDGRFSFVDFFASKPWLRNIFGKLLHHNVLTMAHVNSMISGYGLITEVDGDGKILRSFHDTNSTLIRSTSEVLESGNVLYLGSYFEPFLGALRLK